EALPLLLPPRVACAGGEAHAAGRRRERRAASFECVDELDMREPRRQSGNRVVDRPVDVELATAWLRAGRLPVAADLLHDADDERELLFRAGIDKSLVEIRPSRTHQEVALPGQ